MSAPPDRDALERVMAAVHDSNGGPGTVGELNALRNCREILSGLEVAGVVLMPAQATEEMTTEGQRRAAFWFDAAIDSRALPSIYAATRDASPYRSKPPTRDR